MHIHVLKLHDNCDAYMPGRTKGTKNDIFNCIYDLNIGKEAHSFFVCCTTETDQYISLADIWVLLIYRYQPKRPILSALSYC